MRKQKPSIVITGTLYIAITLILFLPVVSTAGSLEPSEPPGPTMYTLEELYNKPVWKMFDKVFVDWPANPRFAVCHTDGTPDYWDMVLDKETGLVWQRSPWNYEGNWWHAQWQCIGSKVGNRGGWRVPTIHELQSLEEHGQDCFPLLIPCEHPFINLNYCYWSATEYPLDFNEAYYFCPYTGTGSEPKTRTDASIANWCVRGGFGVNLDVSFHY